MIRRRCVCGRGGGGRGGVVLAPAYGLHQMPSVLGGGQRCLEGSPPSLVLTHSESMICVPPRAPPCRPFHQALHPLRAGSTG